MKEPSRFLGTVTVNSLVVAPVRTPDVAEQLAGNGGHCTSSFAASRRHTYHADKKKLVEILKGTVF